MITLKYQSYVGGHWTTPGGKPFSSVNPRTREIVATYASCGAAEAERALSMAHQAYQRYRSLDKDAIAKFLGAIAGEIEALGDQLLDTADRETGLGIPRLTGERARTCGQLRAFAQLVSEGQWVQASIDTAQPDRQPLRRPDIRRMLRPIGPVVVFGASNFPFAFGAVGGDTASALAAGNPVVVKGHSFHPATSELFCHAVAKAAESCGLPEGIFSLLLGDNHALGASLVTHPYTQAVGFTGSLRGGRILMDLAASREAPIPVYTEMGSINPVFICDDALKTKAETIAAGLSASVCMGTGQFCTSPGIVVIRENPEFEKMLAGMFAEKPRGVMLHARIASGFAEAVSETMKHGDVNWLNRVEATALDDKMTPPNILMKTSAAAFLADPKLSEEMFGPAILMVACRDAAQMREVANHLSGNLTATLHATEADSEAGKLLEILEQKVGRVVFNGYPTGVEVVPSQQHGGPYPATSVASSTSVGADAINRFSRFVAYQDAPNGLLPEALKNENAYGIYRKVNGKLSRDPL
ncbi:MAG: aldehyde dehydrogenase (NADP(+)) [Fibrobacteria bacterium]